MGDEGKKFFISQRTLVIILIVFVFLMFSGIIIKSVISGHV